jgi:WD40 repeat protein
MNVNYEFKLLVSAYGDGSICIWDLEDFKFLKHIPNLHESDITSVKIFFVQNNK